jgi:hypothetical protein
MGQIKTIQNSGKLLGSGHFKDPEEDGMITLRWI